MSNQSPFLPTMDSPFDVENGKDMAFPFFQLPAELRCIIYSQHAVSTKHDISPIYDDQPGSLMIEDLLRFSHSSLPIFSSTPSSRLLSIIPVKETSSESVDPEEERMKRQRKRYTTRHPFQILYTCKTIYAEAFDILYTNTHCRINVLPLAMMRRPIACASHIERIKKVEIQIDWKRNPVRHARENLKAMCCVLTNLRALEHVTVSWRVPPEDVRLHWRDRLRSLSALWGSTPKDCYHDGYPDRHRINTSPHCQRCHPLVGPPLSILIYLLEPLEKLRFVGRKKELLMTLPKGSALSSTELAVSHLPGMCRDQPENDRPEQQICASAENESTDAEHGDPAVQDAIDLEDWKEASRRDKEWLRLRSDATSLGGNVHGLAGPA